LKPANKNIYESTTYVELSREFKQLYPTLVHAAELIPRMYNRLTLVDKFSHKGALARIFNDHKDLPGFSRRSIYRALPPDNANVPRRVVPMRHKSSYTKNNMTNRLSPAEKGKRAESKEHNGRPCPNCQLLKTQKEELKEALKASAGPTTAANFAPQIQRFTVLKERHTELIDSMEKSIEFIYLEFDKNGIFLSVIPDSHYKKFLER
jgi:hypothetical protein